MGRYIRDIEFKLLCGHKDCIYAGNLGNKRTYCNYLDLVGHKRPCKPTEDCTEYKTGKNLNGADHALRNWRINK